jgi:hypothetical protein
MNTMYQDLILNDHASHMKLWPCVYYSKINTRTCTICLIQTHQKSFGKTYGDAFQLPVAFFFNKLGGVLEKLVYLMPIFISGDAF